MKKFILFSAISLFSLAVMGQKVVITEDEARKLGFSHIDEDGMKKAEETKLPTWQGLFDFDTEKAGDEKTPWLELYEIDGEETRLDITDKDHALIFAQVMQNYVYEGWFTEENAGNPDAQFRENSLRTWCSTPWLTDKKKGREAIHGLTKEFPMEPNPIYPAHEESFVDKGRYENPTSWGVAFFNKPVCQVYKAMFGTPEKPATSVVKENWHLKNGSNPDGFVSFKMLFSTLPTWNTTYKYKYEGETEYRDLKGAYAWTAHVNTLLDRYNRKPEKRELRKVPHLQMDISFKDSSLSGTKPEVDHWGMITYVYDPKYEGHPYLTDANLPEGLRKMRPVGVQYGLAEGESIIFEGAKTNYMVSHVTKEVRVDGPVTSLNGPADNPLSTCLGCHASAGLEKSIKKRFDGEEYEDFKEQKNFVWAFSVFENEVFGEVKELAGHSGFEFNQQTNLAAKRIKSWLNEKKRAAKKK